MTFSFIRYFVLLPIRRPVFFKKVFFVRKIPNLSDEKELSDIFEYLTLQWHIEIKEHIFGQSKYEEVEKPTSRILGIGDIVLPFLQSYLKKILLIEFVAQQHIC
jgi:hypothetical protein